MSRDQRVRAAFKSWRGLAYGEHGQDGRQYLYHHLARTFRIPIREVKRILGHDNMDPPSLKTRPLPRGWTWLDHNR